jgi:NhaP-type Na+/H+ or K+/H+ antiporter
MEHAENPLKEGVKV